MSENVVWHRGSVTPLDRVEATGGEGVTVWMTGLSGSGKSTIAYSAEMMLVQAGRAAYVLDGDNLRHGLNSDLGFAAADRSENVRRVGEVARLMADAGLVVLVPVISPFASDRKMVREAHEEAGLAFVEVFVDASLEVCERARSQGPLRPCPCRRDRRHDRDRLPLRGTREPRPASRHRSLLVR